MQLPENCTVTHITQVHERLKAVSDNVPVHLDCQGVAFLDISFLQCLKALESQGTEIKLQNPSEATLHFCRLYRLMPLLEEDC